MDFTDGIYPDDVVNGDFDGCVQECREDEVLIVDPRLGEWNCVPKVVNATLLALGPGDGLLHLLGVDAGDPKDGEVNIIVIAASFLSYRATVLLCVCVCGCLGPVNYSDRYVILLCFCRILQSG